MTKLISIQQREYETKLRVENTVTVTVLAI